MGKKLNFSEHAMSVFSAMNTDYEAMNNLMQDLALGREIYDAESDRQISKAEANKAVLEFSRQILGIDDIKDKKAVRRALRDNGREWFDIIEDTIDVSVTVGLQDTDWFTELVESRNIAYGDRQDFVIEDDNAVLAIAKAGTSHHDHILQRITAGERKTVPTQLYAVKVGADINRYILGQEDWATLVAAITKAFILKIQAEVYAEVDTAASKLPVQAGFVDTGALSSATKDNFDAIIANVSAANNGAEVVIMGTKSALQKINALADVNWGATAQKDNVMNTGHIGIYEGTKLVEVPNRFTDKTFTTKVFSEKTLLFMPAIGDAGKFVKFVDEGDTEVLEKTERGEYTSDLMTYEVQRRYGVGTIIGRQFGKWTLP